MVKMWWLIAKFGNGVLEFSYSHTNVHNEDCRSWPSLDIEELLQHVSERIVQTDVSQWDEFHRLFCRK